MFAAITTCPRNVSYLEETINSVIQAGFKPLTIEDYPVRMGIVPNFRTALWHLRHHEWAVVFQDDVRVSKGLAAWLPENVPGNGVLFLYCSAPNDAEDGWRPITEHTWNLGSCGIALHRDVVSTLIEEPPPARTDRLGHWILGVCLQREIPVWIHSPSLVSHIGEVSVRAGMPFNDKRREARFIPDLSRPAELETTVPPA